MITFRITTDVVENRRVVLTLPPEVPTGPTDLIVTVDSLPDQIGPREALADWVEVHSGRNGDNGTRYPLRGSVIRFERPTEPVAEGSWEAAQ